MTLTRHGPDSQAANRNYFCLLASLVCGTFSLKQGGHLTIIFEHCKRFLLASTPVLQLLHSKTIPDQTKVNHSEKGIQTSQNDIIGSESDVVMIKLFPKQETFEEADSQEGQLQEPNALALDVTDVKLKQAEQSFTERSVF